jgi:hypothetical protein
VPGPVVIRAHIHVTTDGCDLEDCQRSGFHFHWRGRVFRSAFDGSMTAAELTEFDVDCAADVAERRREGRE